MIARLLGGGGAMVLAAVMVVAAYRILGASITRRWWD